MKLATLLPAIALLCVPLKAGDYDALGKTIKHAWPKCGTIAVVCDASASHDAVESLASALPGVKLMVVDVKGPQEVGKAVATLGSRKPDAVVLVAGDHVAGDGSSAASFLIQRMAAAKVPTAATTEQGVKQGAVMGVGPGTGGKLLANAKAASATGAAIPQGAVQI